MVDVESLPVGASLLAKAVYPDFEFASMPQGSFSAHAPHLQLAPAGYRAYIQISVTRKFF